MSRKSRPERGAPRSDEVAPEPRDILVQKFRWSAFFGTSLDVTLRLRDVRTLILCGAAIEVGIASTAFAARDLAYDLVIARDACAGSDPSVSEAFLRSFERLARVHTTDEVVAALG
jgi:ureidoacrylate peracid hydrolase